MIIIMISVRYYQSASLNQQANDALERLQAVTSAADQFA